jgi:DNA-binding NtrC family response regulator
MIDMELQDKSILIVEDDFDVCEVLKDYFESHGAQVYTAENGERAVRLVESLDETLDLVVTDIVMPDMDGIGLSIYFKKHFPKIPVIAISGGGYAVPAEYLRSAKALGAWQILEKPVSFRTLDKVVQLL